MSRAINSEKSKREKARYLEKLQLRSRGHPTDEGVMCSHLIHQLAL
jgi:hypothetical protein